MRDGGVEEEIIQQLHEHGRAVKDTVRGRFDAIVRWTDGLGSEREGEGDGHRDGAEPAEAEEQDDGPVHGVERGDPDIEQEGGGCHENDEKGI